MAPISQVPTDSETSVSTDTEPVVEFADSGLFVEDYARADEYLEKITPKQNQNYVNVGATRVSVTDVFVPTGYTIDYNQPPLKPASGEKFVTFTVGAVDNSDEWSASIICNGVNRDITDSIGESSATMFGGSSSRAHTYLVSYKPDQPPVLEVYLDGMTQRIDLTTGERIVDPNLEYSYIPGDHLTRTSKVMEDVEPGVTTNFGTSLFFKATLDDASTYAYDFPLGWASAGNKWLRLGVSVDSYYLGLENHWTVSSNGKTYQQSNNTIDSDSRAGDHKGEIVFEVPIENDAFTVHATSEVFSEYIDGHLPTKQNDFDIVIP